MRRMWTTVLSLSALAALAAAVWASCGSVRVNMHYYGYRPYANGAGNLQRGYSNIQNARQRIYAAQNRARYAPRQAYLQAQMAQASQFPTSSAARRSAAARARAKMESSTPRGLPRNAGDATKAATPRLDSRAKTTAPAAEKATPRGLQRDSSLSARRRSNLLKQLKSSQALDSQQRLARAQDFYAKGVRLRARNRQAAADYFEVAHALAPDSPVGLRAQAEVGKIRQNRLF